MADTPYSAEDIAAGIRGFFIRFGYSNIRHNQAYQPRGPVKTILARYDETGITECPHIALLNLPPGLAGTGKRPEIVLWAAWKPGLIVCHDCRDMLVLSDDTENHRCDGCGIVAEYLSTGTSLIEAESESMPPLACVYGLCAECAKASGITDA